MGDALSEIFAEYSNDQLRPSSCDLPAGPESLLTILETLEENNILPLSMFHEPEEFPFFPKQKDGHSAPHRFVSRPSINSTNVRARGHQTEEEEEEGHGCRKKKKMKLAAHGAALVVDDKEEEEEEQKMSHITVERNRRKQMNDHLSVLRTLMPCFYVKRGDQASIIGGVIDYIKELQQLLQSLEAKKQRKAYSDVLSPRAALSSPRPPPSPRPSPLCSPRVAISPRTPQQGSPYKPRAPSIPSPTLDAVPTDHQFGSNHKNQQAAEVEVKFSGPNLLLKTVSRRIPRQVLKIISLLDGLSLEILHMCISTMEDNMLFSFTIKIGIECGLSVEELAQEVKQTFS